MAENSKIEWTDHTFNPWWGCQKVSPACDHCYAERDAKRFAAGQVLWGVGAERRTFEDKHWEAPGRWSRAPFFQCQTCGARGGDKAVGYQRVCKTCGSADILPARMRVFCASMGDWLDLDAPISEFVRLLDTIRLTPELDWLLLSKRIGNWRKRLEDAATHRLAEVLANTGDPARDGLWQWIKAWLDSKPPANVWLGATVVNQEEADRDIPKLLAVPARVRFLSVEPMLGPVDLGAWIGDEDCHVCGARFYGDEHRCGGAVRAVEFEAEPEDEENIRRVCPACKAVDTSGEVGPVDEDDRGGGLHWIICGGESGPGARPMHPDWARSLRDQCDAAGVPLMLKQWGEWAPAESVSDDDERKLPERWIRHDGSEPAPGAGVDFFGGDEVLFRVGKKAAGRLLDGVEHNGFPEAR